MKPIKDVHIEASQKLNPYHLCHYLKRTEGGDIIVDRSRLIRNKNDERLFYVILTSDYFWNYHNPEGTTIYYEVRNGRLMSGLYDTNLGGKYTRKIIASSETDGITRQYKYSKDAMEEIFELVKHA